jgi:hypothetical protein
MTHTDITPAEQAADSAAEMADELEAAADEADAAVAKARAKVDDARGRARAHGDPAIFRRARDTAARRQRRATALRTAAVLMREMADTAGEHAAMVRHNGG